MTQKKKHIFIHPDHIEDLDETNRRLEASRKEPQLTGYESVCYVYNKARRREILLTKDFVRSRCKTGIFFIFKVVDKSEVMLQPAPLEFINRTSICHVEKRPFAFFRRYAYRAVLDRTPEPAMILYHSGVDPQLPGYTFRMVEYKIQDAAFGEVPAYKLVPHKIP